MSLSDFACSCTKLPCVIPLGGLGGIFSALGYAWYHHALEVVGVTDSAGKQFDLVYLIYAFTLKFDLKY